MSLLQITFLSDLGNSKVLTLTSIVEFLLEFLELTANENVSHYVAYRLSTS